MTAPVTAFAHLTPLPERAALRDAITAAWRVPEPDLMPGLIERATLPPALAARVRPLARKVVEGLRHRKRAAGKEGLVQGLLQEFSLSSNEGVALMCLAEALLRIPDTATRDALIRDKLRGGQWREHVGQSPSFFVNAASWGLMVTGKLVSTYSERGMAAALGRIVAKGGEPMIRKGVDVAMRMMGEQFVTGETIDEALRHARPLESRGFRYSYDMLGEAALTAADARRYLADYEQAIHAIGQAAAGRGVYEGPGISIKLSALHPRYSRAQAERVQDELYPILRKLAMLARQYDIGLNVDAEEADRLELSLDLLERLCFDEALSGWQGIGFVIQAYQKRCPAVIDFLVDLARRSDRRLMIRLVKGAYWDTEIKRAQIDGMDDFPVYTRKPYTDVAYIACARQLLAAPAQIYPQFATHNAQTLATIYELADPAAYVPGQYEFQCLHGMGEPLYDQVVGEGADKLNRPCRIYAPVGTHETLLAYLVRRLLENGANTSFVNRVADPDVAIDDLIEDPVAQARAWARDEGVTGRSHPGIAMPVELYGQIRPNSRGVDLSNEHVLRRLARQLPKLVVPQVEEGPLLATPLSTEHTGVEPVVNPANHADVLGTVRRIAPADVEQAIQTAVSFAPTWAATLPAERAAALLATADRMEGEMDRFIGLLVREAGKSYSNAVAEVREAVDFLRYYAAQVLATFDNATHVPLGPVTCISPWNFPLAIFTGQVAAALAAGNTVLAKPAEQTTLVAIEAIRLLWQSGVPRAAVQLVPGRGKDVGPLLTDDARIQGVMFTGSTAVARGLQAILSRRLGRDGSPVPLVAETGGQNAMIVDSSALAEQVVQDVVMSAFDSAGQRCSALRLLCVQDDVAERLLTMLRGAMQELRLGDPVLLRTDVGPVIDARAREGIEQHIAAMRDKGRTVYQAWHADAGAPHGVPTQGTFVPPTLIEIQSVSELTREVFGPVLHVLRYRREQLDAVLDAIAQTQYGLTMGVHTRIDDTIEHVSQHAHVGNLYINRNMVGAVVGVQPFGGEGLSGTGPKAGGPLYLYRLLARRPASALSRPFGTQGVDTEAARAAPGADAGDVAAWARTHGVTLAGDDTFALVRRPFVLAGPTGEDNQYAVLPRRVVLCQAAQASDLAAQWSAVLRVGGRAVSEASDATAQALHRSLPPALRAWVTLTDALDGELLEAALHHGDEASRLALLGRMAAREGMIVSVTALAPGEHDIPLERLVIERSVSTNTAAAGGNASLMTLV